MPPSAIRSLNWAMVNFGGSQQKQVNYQFAQYLDFNQKLMLGYVAPLYLWAETQHRLLQDQQQTALAILHYLLPLILSQISSEDYAKIDSLKVQISTVLSEGRIRLPSTAAYLFQNKLQEVLQIYHFLTHSLSEEESLQTILLANELEDQLHEMVGAQNLRDKNTAQIYLLIFAHRYLSLLDKILNKSAKHFLNYSSQHLKRTDHLCLKISIKDSLDCYNNSADFFRVALQQPISLLNHFLRIPRSSLFEQVPLSHLVENKQCILSTPIATRRHFQHIKLPNCGFLIDVNRLFRERVFSNNHFVGLVERLNVYDILLGPNNLKVPQKDQHYKQFCLTIVPSSKHERLLFNFFDALPPELKSLSNWDILSYQQKAYLPAFRYKIATEGYWEQCPSSQLIQVYYLCNDCEIEWLSIPSDAYHHNPHKINSWSREQIEQIAYNSEGFFHTMQRQGQMAVIGAGHQHFWRVNDRQGTAVLLNWSILLKDNLQIKRYLDICLKKQTQRTSWKFDIPHRQLVMNYLSHELPAIHAKETRRRLSTFVQKAVFRQYEQLIATCEKYGNRGELRQQHLDPAFRFCGSCGGEIINLFVILQQNVLCFDCLPDELAEDKQQSKIGFAYVVKPEVIDSFLNSTANGYLSETNQQKTFNHEYEYNFCNATFRGCFNVSNCRGQATRQSAIKFKSHLSCLHDFDVLQLHILLQRTYYVPAQGQIKALALLPRLDKAKSKEIQRYLHVASKCLPKRQELSKQLSLFYENGNFVLHALNCLADYTPAYS